MSTVPLAVAFTCPARPGSATCRVPAFDTVAALGTAPLVLAGGGIIFIFWLDEEAAKLQPYNNWGRCSSA